MTRTCKYEPCSKEFEPRRPHQVFHSTECRYAAWAEEQENGGEDSAQRVGGHPLVEARAEQEVTDLKSKLSQIIYQGIIERLKLGPVHADDLEPLFPEEVRDVCRRLVGAQFGSLASRHYIVEKERRKSTVSSRRGAKSGVYVFTKTGWETLVGLGTEGEGLLASSGTLSVEPDEKAASVEHGCAQASASGVNTLQVPDVSPEPLSLLPEPDPKAWAA